MTFRRSKHVALNDTYCSAVLTIYILIKINLHSMQPTTTIITIQPGGTVLSRTLYRTPPAVQTDLATWAVLSLLLLLLLSMRHM